MLHSMCQQIWKTQQWPQDWKRSVFIAIPKKSNTKECSNYCIIVLISHASKVILKIPQDRLKQYVTMNFQMFKLVLEKAEEAEIKLPTSDGSSKKQKSLLIIRLMQIKTTMRYHLTLVRMAIIKKIYKQ